jgi:DNA-binding beta-propeller fold protein YncE
MNLQLTRTSVESVARILLKSTVLIGAASAILLVSGCATAPGPVEEVRKVEHQTVWPLPPEIPRIRYLGDLVEIDIPDEKITLRDVLLGKQETDMVSSLAKPYTVHSDSRGKVYVADTGITGLVVFDLNNNNKTEIWGAGGAGILSKPVGVTSDDEGNVYVSDSMNQRIVIFNSEGNFIDAYGGKDVFELPAGMAYNEKTQRLYVVDTKKHQIVVLDKEGNVDFIIGANGVNPGYFNFPTNIAIDANGRLYVADSMNFRVQVLEPDGTYVLHMGQVGQRIGDFFRLKGVGVDTYNHIYAVDASYQNFQIFNEEGQLLLYVGTGGSGAPGKFALPAGMHVDKNNRIFIADQYNQRIQMFEFIGDAE